MRQSIAEKEGMERMIRENPRMALEVYPQYMTCNQKRKAEKMIRDEKIKEEIVKGEKNGQQN